MWNGLLQNSNVTALQNTLEFTERRHALLAGNIANMDTPGYQTRDLSVDDFQKTLGEAIESLHRKTEPSSEALLDSSQIEAELFGSPLPAEIKPTAAESIQKVRDTMTQVLFHDGSDDSIEQQATEIAKNQSMHGTATTLLRAQFRTLQMAITESVNV